MSWLILAVIRSTITPSLSTHSLLHTRLSCAVCIITFLTPAALYRSNWLCFATKASSVLTSVEALDRDTPNSLTNRLLNSSVDLPWIQHSLNPRSTSSLSLSMFPHILCDQTLPSLHQAVITTSFALPGITNASLILFGAVVSKIV